MSEEQIAAPQEASPLTTPTDAPAAADPVEAVQNPTDASAAPEGKVEEGAQLTPPESYTDFVMPEGVEIDAAQLESALPIFKELGLTQEQAQKLVDLRAEQVQGDAQRQIDAFNQLKTDWLNQSKSDKEFGGDKFDENIGAARTALDKFGTPELRELLDTYGIGNNPEVIRFMVRVGKMTLEDVPGGNNAPSAPKDRVSTLYPANA